MGKLDRLSIYISMILRHRPQEAHITLDEHGWADVEELLAGVAGTGREIDRDMLEEIVGEIRDEYDEDEEDEIREIAPDEYLVQGSTKLDDLNDRLGLSLESQDYDSIGGLVIGLLEHLPEEGESVDHGNLRLLVEHVEKNRIEKVRIEIHKEQEEEETEKDEEK